MLDVGRIVRPHGLKGEVVVQLVTNRPERLGSGTVLYGVRSAPRAGEEAEPELSLTVESARPFQKRYLVRFAHVCDISEAERLRGVTLLAEPITDPDVLFVHDLIGCELVEAGGRSRGRIASVEANPASDLLVGEDGWLVPLRFVVEVSGGKVIVDGPEGLFD